MQAILPPEFFLWLAGAGGNGLLFCGEYDSIKKKNFVEKRGYAQSGFRKRSFFEGRVECRGGKPPEDGRKFGKRNQEKYESVTVVLQHRGRA